MSCHDKGYIGVPPLNWIINSLRVQPMFLCMPMMLNTHVLNKSKGGQENVEMIDFKAGERIVNSEPVKRKQEAFVLKY